MMVSHSRRLCGRQCLSAATAAAAVGCWSILLLCSSVLAQPTVTRQAVPPFTAFQPIYSCQININDLTPYEPRYGHFPPEIKAAELGLNRYNARFPDASGNPILSDGFPPASSGASAAGDDGGATPAKAKPVATGEELLKLYTKNYMAPMTAAAQAAAGGVKGAPITLPRVTSADLSGASSGSSSSGGRTAVPGPSANSGSRTSSGSFSTRPQPTTTTTTRGTPARSPSPPPRPPPPPPKVVRSPPPPPPPPPPPRSSTRTRTAASRRSPPPPPPRSRSPAVRAVTPVRSPAVPVPVRRSAAPSPTPTRSVGAFATRGRHLLGRVEDDVALGDELLVTGRSDWEDNQEVPDQEEEVEVVATAAAADKVLRVQRAAPTLGPWDDDEDEEHEVPGDEEEYDNGLDDEGEEGYDGADYDDVPLPIQARIARHYTQRQQHQHAVDHNDDDEEEEHGHHQHGHGQHHEEEEEEEEEEAEGGGGWLQRAWRKLVGGDDEGQSEEDGEEEAAERHHHHHHQDDQEEEDQWRWSHAAAHHHHKHGRRHHAAHRHHQQQQPQHAAAEEAEDDEEEGHLSGGHAHSRRLQQTTTGTGASMTTCSTGKTKSALGLTQLPPPPGNPNIQLGPQQGFDGLSVNITDVVPMDPTLAVGRTNMIHVINSVMIVYRVDAGGNATSIYTLVTLPNFFNLVESQCERGVVFPSAAYDKDIGRYLLTAVCAGPNRILLAISTGDSAEGTWWLYSLVGEFTNTPNGQFVCGEQAVVNPAYTQITYNADGVYISWYQDCVSTWFDNSGAVIAALPKWAAYKGAEFMWIPYFTAKEVLTSSGEPDVLGFFTGGFRQLQPVMPQRPTDVYKEIVYFVGEPINFRDQGGRRNLVLVTIFNTGALWLYAGPGSSSPTPLLAARVFPRGTNAVASALTKLQQPTDFDGSANIGARGLNAGAVDPRGFWNGGAALYDGLIYIAQRGPDVFDAYNNLQASIYWAILQPTVCVSGPCAVYFGQDWGWDDGWDWANGRWLPGTDRAINAYGNPNYFNNATVAITPQGNLPIMIKPAGGVGSVQAAAGISAVPGGKVSTAGVSTASASSSTGGMLTVTNSATGQKMQVSAANMSVAFSLGGDLWYSGWNGDLLNTYQSFYSYWKEYYFLRNLYMNVRLPVAQNPCKLYANWFTDNVINLGVNIRNVGVIEYASPSVAGLNPLGLAYPQVAVRGGTMLVVYSFSGPQNVSLTNQWAFPGVGYTLIPASAPSTNTPTGQFNLLQFGVTYINQTVFSPQQNPTRLWGSYSGIDMQPGSMRIWSAVGYAQNPLQAPELGTCPDCGASPISNAGVWLSQFA